MRSQSVLIIATRRSSAMSLMIVLAAMFFVSCNSKQPSQSPQTPQPQTQSLDSNSFRQLGTRHDIPPEIVVDVGSFSIDTDKSITNVTSGSTTCNNTCNYRDDNNNVSIAIIKVIRADDGAILYQNFNCADAAIEFTPDTSGPPAPGDMIAIKGVQPSGQKKFIKVESNRTLTVETFNTSPPSPPRRKQKLKDDDLKIKNVKVKVKNGTETLFSYDTPSTPGLLNKYRVVIKLEVGVH